MQPARLRGFMTADVATVELGTGLAEAARLMRERRLSCLLVIEHRVPVGIVTERDFTALSASLLEGVRVGTLSDLMTANLITINADADCHAANQLMQQNRIRRLVVVEDDGSVCGLVTRADILRAHTSEIEQQKAQLEQRVAERTAELEELNEVLTSISMRDPLLDIGNRRAMDNTLADVFERTRRYKRPYAVALVDVDHFKTYNDFYGHQAGDDALVAIASTIKKMIRRTDSVYRYGGEEFLIVLPEVGEEGGAVAAEHVRESVAGLQIPHEKAERGHVTVSIGVAEESLDKPDQNETIARADEALYRAKHQGRNRVVSASCQDVVEDEEPGSNKKSA